MSIFDSSRFPRLTHFLFALIRCVAIFIGMVGFIFSTILFWGVFAAENTFRLTTQGFIHLFGVVAWFALSIFLCLWSTKRQSLVNYFRLIDFPPAILATMLIVDEINGGLLYIALIFVGLLVLWNCAIGCLLHMNNRN